MWSSQRNSWGSVGELSPAAGDNNFHDPMLQPDFTKSLTWWNFVFLNAAPQTASPLHVMWTCCVCSHIQQASHSVINTLGVYRGAHAGIRCSDVEWKKWDFSNSNTGTSDYFQGETKGGLCGMSVINIRNISIILLDNQSNCWRKNKS